MRGITPKENERICASGFPCAPARMKERKWGKKNFLYGNPLRGYESMLWKEPVFP